MRRSVAERLGYDPFEDGAGRSLRARLDRHGGEWSVEITLRGADGELVGERRLTAPGETCDELASSTALAMAIALDPLLLTRPAPQRNVPRRVVTPAAATRPVAPPPVEVPQPPPPRPEPFDGELRFGLGALGSLGTAPSATVGGTVFGGVRTGALYLGAELRADLPGETSVGTGRVRAGQLSGAGVLCGQGEWLGACAVVGGGALRSEAEDVLAATDASTPWLFAGPRAFVDLRLQRNVRLRLQAEVVAQLARTTLVVGDVEVWRSPPVSATAGSALVFLLPL